MRYDRECERAPLGLFDSTEKKKRKKEKKKPNWEQERRSRKKLSAVNLAPSSYQVPTQATTTTMDSAYDPTINRVEEQPPKQADTMSIPPATKTAAAQEEGEGAEQQGTDPTLEEEVKQLVGSVTSWWSGFSKKVRFSHASLGTDDCES